MRNGYFWSVGYCFNVHLSICNLDIGAQESAGWPLYCCLYDTQVLALSCLQLSLLVFHFHQIFSPICGLFVKLPLLRTTS